ncbi:CpaE family protein [Vibrio sp. TBV020]|uniref:AAA family ATPase n=1 Tax=Vibrio sp. TBV020 TaxID=3137398 RepID=UPI0038CD9C76
MNKKSLSVLVAENGQLDSYSLTLAFAEQGITDLDAVSREEELIVKSVVKHGYPIIALDVSGLARQQAESLISALKIRTGSHILAIGDDEQIAFYRAMIKAGASEYVLNPVEVSAFDNVDFHSVNQEDSTGKVISIVGAKGGVGSSTVAVNLARELSQRGDAISIADMDFSTGDLDLQYNVQGNTSLVEMLQYPERLEPVVYARSGIAVEDNLTLFTGYLPLDASPFWPEKSALDHFRKFCLKHSNMLIQDLPTFSMRDQIGLNSLTQADIRILVVEPTLASIRNAGQILRALESTESTQSARKNVIVVNHTKSDKASLISCNDVQRALGYSVDVVLPYAPGHFLTKDSLGYSALKGNRKVNRAFAHLADLVAGESKIAKRRFWKRGA